MYVVNNERNVNCELGYDRTLSIATMTFNGGNGAADDSLSNYKVIRVGDIAFEGHTNKVHAYGRFVLNDAGDGLMSPRFSCLRPIVEQRYSFWKYYIPREESMRPILVNATKNGTMMNELVPDDLMHESILVPCLAEQEVIGNSFSQLDHVITLHQRKCQYRGLYGYLSWEQRKLGDITSSYSGGTPQANNPDYYNGSIPFIRSAEINADKTELYLTEKGLAESSAALVDAGCILYALYGATSGEAGISRINGAINQAILAIYPYAGFDSGFLASWLRREKDAIVATYLQGGQGNLSGAIVKDFKVPVPGLPEQKAIGDCLSSLDNLITLHQ